MKSLKMAFPRLLSFLKTPAHKRRRIVFLFALGIVLPSVLLGYLALRGIQNDRALLEKERLDESRRIAERIIREIDEEIAAVEAALFAAKADSYQEKTGAPTLTSVLERFEAEHPLVEQVFFLQELKVIRYPVAKLLYIPDARREAAPFNPQSRLLLTNIKRAQQLEFQQKNYPNALAAYQQALKQTDDPRLWGEILNAVARIQKKSALLPDAAATYERIARDYNQVVISNGIPLGLVARLELGSLLRELNDFSRSLTTFLELYRSLIHREWPLEKAQFEFYVGRTKSSLGEFISSPPPGLDITSLRSEFERLEKEEKEEREATERTIAFQEGAAPALEAKIIAAADETDRSAVRLTTEIGRHSYLVSMLRYPGQDRDRLEEIWGIILDAERLKEDILRPALGQLAGNDDMEWVVKGRDGDAMMSSSTSPSGPVTIRANFASNFPDWTLEFHQPPPDIIRTFLLSRHGVYSYMFLLIAGILIFGLILTIRTVSHELELAKMKSDFVSTISHEFKSPLTSIRQLAEMLHSGRVPSEERRQKYYDVLLEQSERLSLLTDNILNLAKIEEGRKEFRFETTDLGALLREVVSSIQDRVRHEGFSIELEIKKDLPVIMVDRDAMAQAITNLLDNAVKYSGESKRVIVSASDDGASLHIAVRDFGIGIRKEDLDKVFERFFRGGDELTRTVKGSGLGLSLVKEIVEAHKGKVHVESEPGKGCTFFVKLPFLKGEEK